MVIIIQHLLLKIQKFVYALNLKMAKKLMRCSSSGKLMRDNVTGKLMVFNPIVEDCEYCNVGETPAAIDITFADVLNCPCEIQVPTTSVSTEGYAESLNGTFRLLQSESIPCRWMDDASCSGERYVWWTSEDCSSGKAPTPYTGCEQMSILVTRGATFVEIKVVCGTVELNTLFYGTGVPSSKCVELVMSNETVCEAETIPARRDVCYSGLATIVEVW